MHVLGPNDFSNTFTIAYQGPLLLYVKQQNCGACITFNPIFAALASDARRRQLGLPDSLHFATVVYSEPIRQRSNNSPVNVNITHTPMLILFYNHEPIAKYSGPGPLSEQVVVSFIASVFKDVLNVDLFAAQAQQAHPNFTQFAQQPQFAQPQFAQPPQTAQKSLSNFSFNAPRMYEAPRLDFAPPRVSQFAPNKPAGNMYMDDIPNHFDQPQFGDQPPIHAPITWRTKHL